jgi:hypothetical protein
MNCFAKKMHIITGLHKHGDFKQVGEFKHKQKKPVKWRARVARGVANPIDSSSANNSLFTSG